MSTTIPDVRNWQLYGLTDTATGLRNGATKMSEGALTIINRLAGIDTDWNGEFRDRVVVTSRDHRDQLQQKAKRWNGAATVLDEGAEQLGLLKQAILGIVDDPTMIHRYNFSPDGDVSLTTTYVTELTHGKSKEDGDDAVREANNVRATNEIRIRSLLATAAIAAQLYDHKITTALAGGDWLTMRLPIPGPPPLPADTLTAADADHCGPSDYRSKAPDEIDRARLNSETLAAQILAGTFDNTGMPRSARALRHFLEGTGKPTTIDADALLRDVKSVREEADQFTRSTANAAISAMPQGYRGPVAFVSDWATVDHPPGIMDRDWYQTLGNFSSQTSGIATPNGDGTYSVRSQVSFYDYYNFSPTDGAGIFGPLNDLHQNGYAQNYNASGSSSASTFTFVPSHSR